MKSEGWLTTRTRRANLSWRRYLVCSQREALARGDTHHGSHSYAIQEKKDGTFVVWLEHVSDQQYSG